MAITLHAPDRHAPAMPPPLPPIHAIKRAHATASARPAPSAAMKRLALVIACAAVYFAFSATFEPARSQARVSADAQGRASAQADPLLPTGALQDATPLPARAFDLHDGSGRATGTPGDHAP